METTPDRSIREKLNSLDTLPEGYAPSLDSKWELLMAGQTAPKKRPAFLWYAAAASFVLLLGFSFLLFRTSRQLPTAIVAKAPNEKTNPKPASKKKSAELPSHSIAQNAMEKQGKTTQYAIFKNQVKDEKLSSNNAMPLAVKTRGSKNHEANITVIPASENQLIPIDPAETPEKEIQKLAVAALPKVTQKKKARFVEMDFEAPAKPQLAATSNPQTAKMQFKIKVLPKANEDGPAVVQNEKPLRLQHTF